MYTSKASAERAYKGYLGSKYAEEQQMTTKKLDERKLVHAVDEDNGSEKPRASDITRMMKLAGINKKLEDDQEEGRVDFNGVFTGVAKGDIEVKESRFGMMAQLEAGMPSSIVKTKQRYAEMPDEELAAKMQEVAARNGKDIETLAREQAWRHGYGKMSSYYWDRIKDYVSQTEEMAMEAPVPDTSDPFVQGVDACADNKHVGEYSVCRYPAGSPEAARWNEGWAACEQYGEHEALKMGRFTESEESYNRTIIEMIVDEIRAGKTPAQISEDLAFEEGDIQRIYDMVSEKALKRKNISQLPEGKKPDFLDVDKDGNKKEPMTKALKDKKKVKEGYRAPKNGSFKYLAPHPTDPEDEVEIDVEWELTGETGRDGFVFYATGPDGNEFPLDSNLEDRLADHLQAELEGDYADWGDYEYERRRDSMMDSYDSNLNELSKDEALQHNVEVGEMVRVTNFKAKTARYKVLAIKGDKVKLEKPDGSTMVMPLERIKRVKAQAYKHQNSMMGEGANVKALQQQFKDLEREYNAVLAGMSNADENEIADEMERLADQIERLGGVVENDQMARLAKLAGVQYSAPRAVTEDDLNEDSSLSSLGLPKSVISRIHRLTRAAHDVSMIPVRNKSELKAALDNQGFVVVVGNGEYGVAAYSHGYGSGRNVYYEARSYDAEGNIVAKERGALSAVLKILPNGKYYGFNPEKSRGWGNEWRGKSNPYSSEVRWSGADEMVTKIADRVEERAHEALKVRALEIRDQLSNQLEPGEGGIDLGDNYEKLTQTMKHAASLYKKPEQFRSHLESVVKRYLLKFEHGTDKVHDYAVNPDKWSKMNYGKAPRDNVSSRIDLSRKGNKYKSEGQLINRVARAVIDFYRNLGDQYSDDKVAASVGNVN